MPVTPTYPGIYIEELPSSAHTIAGAPTSIAVFVGYTHPYKTRDFAKPVRLFGFADYERHFGGFFRSAAFDDLAARDQAGRLADAVNHFFLNGGSVCHVVGLEPHFYIGDPSQPVAGPAKAVVASMVFTAREPVDDDYGMIIGVDNVQFPGGAGSSYNFSADVTITYGSKDKKVLQTEVYRQVSTDPSLPGVPGGKPNPNYFKTRIGTADNPVSSLVTAEESGGSFSAPFPGTPVPEELPAGAVRLDFRASDFVDVFRQDGPLDKLDIFNLLNLPGVTHSGILGAALAFCERKLAFLIMDPPRLSTADGTGAIEDLAAGATLPKSKNGALYFPYLLAADPLTGLADDTGTVKPFKPFEVPPGGAVAGIYARTDLNRGVWKAPAGLETNVLTTTGVVERGRMTDQRQGVLNPLGVNALRDFPGVGTVVFGARTLVSPNPAQQQWRYVPVRRMALFLEQTLYRNLGWVVFEPNDEPLWLAIRTSIEKFLLGLFRQGAFQGATPGAAFQVKCDAQTTTQQDIDNGIVNIVVGFAPLKPAEFVIIKIAQLAGQTQA
jgi:phage tail sheath protein FI